MQVRAAAFDPRNRPGELPSRAVAVVVLASVVILVAALVGGHLLADLLYPDYWYIPAVAEPCSDCELGYVPVWIDPWSLRNGLALGLAIGMAIAFLPRFSLSRWLRLAVLLPLALLVAGFVAWDRWPVIASVAGDVGAPLAGTTGWALALAIPWTAAAGWLACKRRREWLHGALMIALLDLLLVGVWLPIAGLVCSRMLGEPTGSDNYEALLLTPGAIAVCIVPPLAIAFAYTRFAMRNATWSRRHNDLFGSVLAVLVFISLVMRIGADYGAVTMYVNCIPMLLAFAATAVLGLAALGADVAIRLRRARRLLADDPTRRSGTLASCEADPVVARLEIASWLRGPRANIQPCVLTSPRGDVPIDIGAEIAMPIPALSTHLAVGESIELARAGATTVVAGLVPPPIDHPFRDSVALVPGPNGIVVGDPAIPVRGFANVALAIWRPCLAYLVIVIGVAVVGLVGVMADGS
jgi:hypothetical protein